MQRSKVDDTGSKQAHVVGLASDGSHRFSKPARTKLTLLEGLGVEGDAHAGPFVRHRYLARRNPGKLNLRQIHLLPMELLDTLRVEGCDLGPGDLGENVLTAGIDLERLPLGTVLNLGAAATVEITGLRTPCVLIDRFRPGLKPKLVVSDGRPQYRCGIMGAVRSGGGVMLGDPIAIEFPHRPWRQLPAL